MAEHNLALGGRPKEGFRFGQNILPSVPYLPNEAIVPDARRSSTTFALTRCLNFGVAENCDCVTDGYRGSIALREYVRNNPIAVGDVLNVVFLPARTRLLEVAWFVESPLPSFDFDIRVANYDPAVATPLALATSVPGGVVGWDVLDVTTIAGDPLLIRTNAVLQVVIKALPPLPADTGCNCPACDRLASLNLVIAPVVRHYETGCN